MVTAKHGQARDTVLPMNVGKGKYMAILQAEWKCDHTYDITFRYTGNVSLECIGRERSREKPDFLNENLINRANELGKFKPIDSENQAEWMRVYFADALLWVDVIKNNKPNRIYVQQFFEGTFIFI